MHAPSLHRWHIVDLSSAFITHHQKFSTACLILALLVLMYGLTVQLKPARVVQPVAPVVSSSAGRAEPLTRLTAALSNHEYYERASYIADSFGELLEEIQASQVYLVVYENVFSQDRGQVETHVTSIFEMDRMVAGFDFGPVQGISRTDWLKTKTRHFATRAVSAENFHRYGLELHNSGGAAIGYLGLELQQDVASLHKEDFVRIHRAGESLKMALLQPLDTLNSSEIH